MSRKKFCILCVDQATVHHYTPLEALPDLDICILHSQMMDLMAGVTPAPMQGDPDPPQVIPGVTQVIPASIQVIPGPPQVIPGVTQVIPGPPQVIPGVTQVIPAS